MDESIQILKSSVEEAKIGEKDKLLSLQRLRQFIPENNNSLDMQSITTFR